MKGKIGILTFHNSINYGAVLQCYALENVLKDLGAEVEVINYDSENIKRDNRILNTDNIKKMIKSIILAPINIIRKEKFKKFISKNLNLSEPVNKKTFKEMINKKYSKIVVGSDQVWNRKIISGEEEIFFLRDFIGKKYSYAASTGNASNEDIEFLKRNIFNFETISIREARITEILKNNQIKNAITSIDPTLLLTADNWKNKLKIEEKPNKDILIYSLAESTEFRNIVENIRKYENINLVKTFSKKNLGIKGIKKLPTADPKEFVEEFMNAKYIITNSFHGVAFSILFNKKFFVVLPPDRKERILNILKIFKLEKHIVQNEKDIKNIINITIDNRKIQLKKIEEAKKYLQENIMKK